MARGWMLVVGALVSGCTGIPGTTKTSGTGDTGATADTGACPASVAPLAATVCAEGTNVPSPPTGTSYGYEDVDLAGSGVVTEVGGGLAAVPGSVPVDGFRACGAEHEHQVRIVDGAGDTWTFGWDIEGPVDDASDEPFAVDLAVDFHAVYRFLGYSDARGLLLGDGVGPWFVYELEDVFDDAEVGGPTVDLDRYQSCTHDDVREFTAIFTGVDGGVTELQSGGTGTVTANNGVLAVVLANAWEYEDCADGCSAFDWAGWAEVP